MRALLWLLLVPTIAHAEVVEKGLRGGGAVMSLSRDMGPSSQQSSALISRPGWIVGAWATWRANDYLSLQLEASVSGKHLRTEECSNGCMTTSNISLYYFEAPVLMRIDLLPRTTKFHFDLGVDAAVGLGGGASTPDAAFARFDDLVPVNVGPVAGLGFQIGAGPGRIAVDVRYKRWLLPITDGNSNSFGSNDQEIRPSHQVMATVGYAFP